MLERLSGGRDNLALALYMNNLGATYDDTGQHRTAIEYHEKALAMYDHASDVAPNDPRGPREGGMRAAHWGEVEWARPRLEETLGRDERASRFRLS